MIPCRQFMRHNMSLPRISMSGIRGISTLKAVEQLTSLLQDKNSRRAAPMRSSTDTEILRLSRVRSDLAIEISKQYNHLPSIKPRSSEDCERCKILDFLATNVQGQTSPQRRSLLASRDLLRGLVDDLHLLGVLLEEPRHAMKVASLWM